MTNVFTLPVVTADAPAVQRSPEWFAKRIGKFTGSQFPTLMAGLDTESYKGYIREKAWERLTGKAVQTFTNDAMQHGIDTEPQARSYYEFVADAEVVEVGFMVHADYPYVGVSPDGLVGDKGMIEIKCPQPKTHIEYLAAKKLPANTLAMGNALWLCVLEKTAISLLSQNSRSNFSLWRLIPDILIVKLTMIVHAQMLASARPMMTALTTRSASRNNLIGEKPTFGVAMSRSIIILFCVSVYDRLKRRNPMRGLSAGLAVG